MTALTTIPNPQGMDWQDWADTVVGFNQSLRNMTSPDLDWESFADRLTFLIPATPNPRMFDDWRPWAEALQRALSL